MDSATAHGMTLDEWGVMIPAEHSTWERDGRLLHVSAVLAPFDRDPGMVTVTTREPVGRFVCRIDDLPEHIRRHAMSDA